MRCGQILTNVSKAVSADLLRDCISGMRKREEPRMSKWIIVVPFTEMRKAEARAGLKKFKSLDADVNAREPNL